MDLLALVGLADQADKLPSMVSGGQQQRAAIARALANDPPLLVGDEPTGNLDSQTAQDVFALFEKLVAQGKTILLVTHDKELAQRVPRRLEIVNGCIARDERLHLERATQRPMSAPGIGA
jgi:putative ABC transport system ATP-binding protein